jgi:hypothetical protein
MRLRAALILACLGALAAGLPATARASQIVTRDATAVSLKVDRYGRALVTYRTGGVLHHTLFWGGINARFPDPAHPKSQIRFRTDYSGGGGVFHRPYWKTMVNVCGRYTGPALRLVVKACTMPDGSSWVLQNWRRLMPNGGEPCCRSWEQGRLELHISHFKGPIARLWLKWYYTPRMTFNGHHLDELFGRISYLGHGAYGFSSDRIGNPTDSFGELVYVDTYNSAWGRGWKRVNSFLAHKHADGGFCDQLWPSRFGRRNSPGTGTRYRAFADGPGVTPVVYWEGPPPGNYGLSENHTRNGLGLFSILGNVRMPFDPAVSADLAAEQRALAGSSIDGCWKTW